MKKIYILAVAILFLATSCQKENSTEIPQEPEQTTNTPQPLNVLNAWTLNHYITMPKDEFIAKLQEANVTFKDDGLWIVYFVDGANTPFKKYRIRVTIADVFDLDKRPYEPYKGVERIEIFPLGEDDKNAVEEDYKKVFDYFYPKFTELQPTKSPYRMAIENTDASPKLYKIMNSYEEFISDLSVVDATIDWNNNPPTEVPHENGGVSLVLKSEDSSKAKNTPKIKMVYYYGRKGYKITIAFNAPTDWKNYKKE